MTTPTPLTDNELADLPDPALWDYVADIPELAARLLATVNAEQTKNARLREELSAARDVITAFEPAEDVTDGTTEADRG